MSILRHVANFLNALCVALMCSSRPFVAMSKRGNKRGNEIRFFGYKPIIFNAFKVSFERFHKNDQGLAMQIASPFVFCGLSFLVSLNAL